MNINDIGLALTGDSLITAINNTKNKRAAYAEGLLYEQTIVMVASDPGVGKSTITTQVAVELSAGIPVFGIYDVPKPVKVLYVQTERGIIELLERLEVINKIIPINKDKLVITDNYQFMDLVNYEHLKMFIACIKRDCPDVEVIVIDPIYPMVSGGLKDDKPASAFTKGMSLVQKETGATLWYNHHTVKKQYDTNGVGFEKDDPFYGSQWLKAHVTGSFYLRQSDTGVCLINKKDNYRLMPSKIDLNYNSQTELCSVPINKLSAIDKVRTYIKMRAIDKAEFCFNDMRKATDLSPRKVREILADSNIINMLEIVNTVKHKHTYRVKI